MPEPHLDPFAGREAPRSLEHRVTGSLRTAGLLEPASARLGRRAAVAAVLVASMGASFLTGRMSRQGRPAGAAQPEFLLLLYEGAEYRDTRPTREIVSEYAAWADSLRGAGALVLGEKLGDASIGLPAVAGSGTVALPRDIPTGLFIVRAPEAASATALASTSPHLRYGGRILVSPIERE